MNSLALRSDSARATCWVQQATKPDSEDLRPALETASATRNKNTIRF